MLGGGRKETFVACPDPAGWESMYWMKYLWLQHLQVRLTLLCPVPGFRETQLQRQVVIFRGSSEKNRHENISRLFWSHENCWRMVVLIFRKMTKTWFRENKGSLDGKQRVVRIEPQIWAEGLISDSWTTKDLQVQGPKIQLRFCFLKQQCPGREESDLCNLHLMPLGLSWCGPVREDPDLFTIECRWQWWFQQDL